MKKNKLNAKAVAAFMLAIAAAPTMVEAGNEVAGVFLARDCNSGGGGSCSTTCGSVLSIDFKERAQTRTAAFFL